MISLKLLVEWHRALVLPIEFGWFPGPREPEYGVGDNVAVITPSQGPALDLEGVGDWSVFQTKLVGKEHQYDDLQKSAFEADRQLVRELTLPADLWGTRVVTVDRVGGQPDMLQEDEHDRIAFVCSYLVHELI